MSTPNLDFVIRDVENLKNQITYLKLANEKLNAELKQKQASWDKAANYRDEFMKLREENVRLVAINTELGEERNRLREENAQLEKRINERYSDANYHMRALDRLANFIKPNNLSSEGVVDAAINWIKRLLMEHESSQQRFRDLEEDRDKLHRWKNEAMLVDKQIMSIDRYVRDHPEALIGDCVWSTVGKWLVERDYLKRKCDGIRKILP